MKPYFRLKKKTSIFFIKKTHTHRVRVGPGLVAMTLVLYRTGPLWPITYASQNGLRPTLSWSFGPFLVGLIGFGQKMCTPKVSLIMLIAFGLVNFSCFGLSEEDPFVLAITSTLKSVEAYQAK